MGGGRSPELTNYTAPFRQTTFHKVYNDNNFPYPFKDISHLNVTRRYSAARIYHTTPSSSSTSLSADKRPQGKRC